MEPVTHMLTGAVLARTGFHRRALYATAAMAIAAELPDIDMLWSAAGPVAAFEHHRGITHTLLGIPFEAAALTALAWGVFRLRQRSGDATRQKAGAAPPNWLLLFGGTVLALLSHILLDWTNNYGVRPFFPFDPHWYAGSIVFIFEPVLFLILVGALVLPPLFRLINAEVNSGRRQAFASPGWSLTGLVLVAALYLYRADQHGLALKAAAENTPGATRVFASPQAINPWLWSTVAETPATYQLATIDTHTGLADPPIPSDTIYKPPTTLALMTAKRSEVGRVYLDWSSFPVLMEVSDRAEPGHPLVQVTFADARFFYNSFLGDGRANPSLQGSVLLDMQSSDADRVIEMKMGRRVQR